MKHKCNSQSGGVLKLQIHAFWLLNIFFPEPGNCVGGKYKNYDPVNMNLPPGMEIPQHLIFRKIVWILDRPVYSCLAQEGIFLDNWQVEQKLLKN